MSEPKSKHTADYSKFWSEGIETLEPYVPGEQLQGTDILKLNTNEAPYAPAPAVLEAVRCAADERLRKYPEPESDALRQVAADYYGLKPDEVFAGNGSDEILGHIFSAFFRHGTKKILFPDITYSFYRVYARYYGVNYEMVPLAEDFQIDLGPYRRADCTLVSGIIFPNPNAPTGLLLSAEQIRSLAAQQSDILIVVDEAYIDFGGESVIPLVKSCPNLLVTQTMSKSRALAGLRVGFAFGQASLLEALYRVKNSFNSYPLDRVAQQAAAASFKSEDYFQKSVQQVISTREAVSAELETLGFEVLPSKANFVFVRHPDVSAADLHVFLRSRGILVRHFSGGRCDDFLRISIGLPDEMRRFLDTIICYLQRSP